MRTDAGGSVGVLAIVDSGASRSFFPKRMAQILGLDPAHLKEDDIGASGVEGGSFPTWSATKEVEGQIVRVDPQTHQASYWGPVIKMDPAFADKNASLLGRSDFFPTFDIAFSAGANGPLFTVEY